MCTGVAVLNRTPSCNRKSAAAPAATRAIIAQQSEILHDQPGDEEVPALFLHAPCHTRPFRARDLITSIRSCVWWRRLRMMAAPRGCRRARRAPAHWWCTRGAVGELGWQEYELEDGGSAIVWTWSSSAAGLRRQGCVRKRKRKKGSAEFRTNIFYVRE